MKALRILIADDHDIVRVGLRSMLAPHREWQICGEAANGREAVEQAEQLKPDAVVLDFSMPDLDGLEATRRIRKSAPSTAVFLLTMHEADMLTRDALAAGARGCVGKSDTKRRLVPLLEALARREPPPSASGSGRKSGGWAPSESGQAGLRAPLTPRQRDIVQLLAAGMTSKAIAAALGLSVKTVTVHRNNILHKLDLHSARQVVLYAIRNRIVRV